MPFHNAPPARFLCLLGLVAAFGLSACGSSNSGTGAAQGVEIYGSLPPVGTPTHGGTITQSQITGSTPTYIFPIIPAAQGSAYTVGFITNLFLPLYNGPNGKTPEINYALSLANKPTFTDGDKTVTIPMKKGFKWADGKPVTAHDLIFEIDLLKAAVKESAANWSQYVPGEFPTSVVSATAPDDYTVVLKIDKAYNPGFFLNNQLQTTENVTPLPSTAWNIAAKGGPHLDYTNPANAKKIFDYLSKEGSKISGFDSNPLWKVVDGPFKLAKFNTTNSSYDFVPNPSYGGSPKPYADKISVQTFTGITPQLNALRTGSLDVSGIDFSQLGAVPGLRKQGYSVFGYPPFGWFGAVINFKDKTNHFDKIIGQLYTRQALARLIDQPSYVKGIFKNAAVPAYGPVPSVPKTPFTPENAIHTPYPYSPAVAAATLRQHGWNVVPGGTSTCAKPGTGPGQCGAGIPKGTPFKFTWFYTPASSSPSSGLESEALASIAKKAAGINIELKSKTFNYMIANFNDADPSVAKHTNEWGVSNYGGFSYDFFPTSDAVFNTTGAYNGGGYSSAEADRLIQESVHGSDPNAVTAEASFLTKDIPIFFMPNSDYVYAISKRVGGASSSFLALTELSQLPQFWYLKK